MFRFVCKSMCLGIVLAASSFAAADNGQAREQINRTAEFSSITSATYGPYKTRTEAYNKAFSLQQMGYNATFEKRRDGLYYVWTY